MISREGMRPVIGMPSRPIQSSTNIAVHVSRESMAPSPDSDGLKAKQSYGSTPFYFEQNMGQADPSFDFVSRGAGYTLGLSATEAVMALPVSDNRASPLEIQQMTPEEQAKLDQTGRPFGTKAPDPASAPLLRMQIVGGNAGAQVTGVDQLVTKTNYFIGNDPDQWHTNVPTFARVQYDDVYPGIDLVYYSKQNDLEYDFIVAPEVDPSQVQLSFTGVNSAHIDAGGDLILQVGDNEIRQQAPYIYQEFNGSREQVPGSFVLNNQQSESSTFNVSFALGDYDTTRPLVIDPMVVTYSTFIGGTSSEAAYGVDVDEFGSAYFTGRAYAGFPLVNPAFSYGGAEDAFVAKFSSDGSTLLYSTYIGGSYEDQADSISVDGKGAAYVTGYSLSGNFPTTPGAFQPLNGDGTCNGNTDCADAFIAKLGPDGSSLIYSTYLGTKYTETGEGIEADATGNAYVMGMTNSDEFPILNAAQSGYGGGGCNQGSKSYPCFDVFVTKFNPTGSALIYSTYLGGASDESYFFHNTGDIRIDLAGHAYITGYTYSWASFPLHRAVDPIAQSLEAFVTKLSPDGSSFIHSSFLGGYPGERGRGVTADVAGNTYVAGLTCADDFPTTPDSYKPTKSGSGTNCDGFISKIAPNGSSFVYSTFFGGDAADDEITAIDVDSAGNVYVAGFT